MLEVRAVIGPEGPAPYQAVDAALTEVGSRDLTDEPNDDLGLEAAIAALITGGPDQSD